MKAQPFDLAALDTAKACDAGTEIELVHPVTKEGLGIFLGILGRHSEKFRAYERDLRDRAVRKAFEARNKGKQVEAPRAAESEAETIEALASMVYSFRTEVEGKEPEGKSKPKTESVPYVVIGGEHIAYSHDAAVALLTRFIWAREQVDEAIGDIENFISNLSKA